MSSILHISSTIQVIKSAHSCVRCGIHFDICFVGIQNQHCTINIHQRVFYCKKVFYFSCKPIPRKAVAIHVLRGGSYFVIHNEEDLYSCHPPWGWCMSLAPRVVACAPSLLWKPNLVSFTCMYKCSMMLTPSHFALHLLSREIIPFLEVSILNLPLSPNSLFIASLS